MTERYTLTLNLSKSRAAAHRAMALAALHADSSLSVRLKRYTVHMTKARALEAESPAQLVDTGSGIAIEHKRQSIKTEG